MLQSFVFPWKIANGNRSVSCDIACRCNFTHEYWEREDSVWKTLPRYVHFPGQMPFDFIECPYPSRTNGYNQLYCFLVNDMYDLQSKYNSGFFFLIVLSFHILMHICFLSFCLDWERGSSFEVLNLIYSLIMQVAMISFCCSYVQMVSIRIL